MTIAWLNLALGAGAKIEVFDLQRINGYLALHVY